MGHNDTVRSLSFGELRGIVAPIAKKYGMIRVYLFGSRARGDNNEESDFDFCVVIYSPFGNGLQEHP
ncbi:MAG: nucleotidyltransferase domain-containing protein [Candidatus Methanoplasma sp.]|jgi:predicted nucleotidyltransferase|nr:nucleotidyltransferase domain-containing protein [Candidatus Methanoplasma sp.]